MGLANWLAPSNLNNGWLGELLWGLVVITPVIGIPLACVVAVLKYRLYDLGRVVSRTVTYAIVTGLLIGVYADLVLLATQVLTITSPVAVAGATLAAAALFGPLRSRVQHRVDRRFNRARYSAERLIDRVRGSPHRRAGRRRGNRGPGPFGTCRPGTRPPLDLAQRTLGSSHIPDTQSPSGLHGFVVLCTDAGKCHRCGHHRARRQHRGGRLRV